MGPIFTPAIVLQALEFALDIVCFSTRSFDHFFFVSGLAAAVFILTGPLLVFQLLIFIVREHMLVLCSLN